MSRTAKQGLHDPALLARNSVPVWVIWSFAPCTLGPSQYGFLHFGQTHGFSFSSRTTVTGVFAKHAGLDRRIFTDDARYFLNAYRFGPHETVKHATHYAVGRIHINHVENAWSLFKRGLTGVYHFVSAKYLQDYLDEFAFRGSHRSERDAMVSLVLACC